MSTMTRRAFLGMAGVAGAGLWLGLPGTARADVTRETRVMLVLVRHFLHAGVRSP